MAALGRRGTFAERGYKSVTGALRDLLGWELFEARRRVTAAEQVTARVGLDGDALPARLPHAAAAFERGEASLRHVDVVARVLATPAAARLAPEQWAGAEEQIAAKTAGYTPSELHAWGTALVEALDQDGAEPDDRPPPQVNELFLTRAAIAGGKIKGRFDDAAMFDAIAAVIDAKAKPLTADDDRSAGERQAAALADACGYVLDHGDVPECGGHRPHVNVLVRLEDLENRARAAALDFGGTVSPESLRMLCCDAAVVPIVMDAAGQPLDVGRATRTIPDGLRRRSPPGTAAARIPGATGRRRGASATTSCPGSTGARRSCPIWHVVPGPPPADPFHGVDLPDPRRVAGVHPAGVDRPGAQAAAKSVAASCPSGFRTGGVTAASNRPSASDFFGARAVRAFLLSCRPLATSSA